MVLIVGAFELYHAVNTGEGRSRAFSAMGVKLLFRHNIATSLD